MRIRLPTSVTPRVPFRYPEGHYKGQVPATPLLDRVLAGTRWPIRFDVKTFYVVKKKLTIAGRTATLPFIQTAQPAGTIPIVQTIPTAVPARKAAPLAPAEVTAPVALAGMDAPAASAAPAVQAASAALDTPATPATLHKSGLPARRRRTEPAVVAGPSTWVERVHERSPLDRLLVLNPPVEPYGLRLGQALRSTHIKEETGDRATRRENCNLPVLNMMGLSAEPADEAMWFAYWTALGHPKDQYEQPSIFHLSGFQKWRRRSPGGQGLPALNSGSFRPDTMEGVGPDFHADLNDAENFGVTYAPKDQQHLHHTVNIRRVDNVFHVYDPRPEVIVIEALKGSTAVEALKSFVDRHHHHAEFYAEYLVEVNNH